MANGNGNGSKWLTLGYLVQFGTLIVVGTLAWSDIKHEVADLRDSNRDRWTVGHEQAAWEYHQRTGEFREPREVVVQYRDIRGTHE